MQKHPQMVDSKELVVEHKDSRGGQGGDFTIPPRKYTYGYAICVLRRRYSAVSPLPPTLLPSG
jgi:hypothetical protein